MKRGAFALLALILVLTACGKDDAPQPSATSTPKPTHTRTPPAATATETATATATATPWPAGDIGWRKVKGVVYAGTDAPGNELAGALVECSQFSYFPREGSCAPYQITTDSDGAFEFDVFVHDTDSITLSAQKTGCEPVKHRLVGLDCLAVCPFVELVLETASQPH